ncbi:MAG TPA: hypothetical protein VJN68_08665 [Burkholderiaceae bacterium]|nr:hypothetical protein [Burkholderiaceae bacterium]
MAGPERWSADAGTRDVARLDIPADALHERDFEIFCRAVVVERTGSAGGWHEMSVRVNGALEWTRRVEVAPNGEDSLDLRLRRSVPVGRPLRLVVQSKVQGVQRRALTISADQDHE